MEGNWIFGGLHLLGIIQLLPFLIEGNLQDNYIGCYYDDANNQSHPQNTIRQNNTTLTIEWCIGQCSLRGSTYAGLENSTACLCGDDIGVNAPDISCNSLCPGNKSEYCGGYNGQRTFYSIYAVCEIGYYGNMCDQVCHCKGQAPCNRMTGICPKECEGRWFGTTCSNILMSEKYIGCFRDGQIRAISPNYFCDEVTMSVTVEFCSNICTLRNNSIVGLQAGMCCSCGENYTRYGLLSDNSCSDPCRGNPSQKCGGPWANSVYSVCPAGYYGPNCLNKCHCYNNSRCSYLTGECNSTCKAGWTGSSCNSRDCKTENGDCSLKETCATVNLNFATVTGCRCLPGFKRKAFWDKCRDIDECVLGVCDASTTYCTNTIGGYNCTCKSGYRQYNDNICYVIPTDGIQGSSSGSHEKVYSVGVVIGSAFGAAIGAAAIFAVILIVVIVYRRRRLEREQCEVANQIRHKGGTSETPVDPMPDYETVGKNPNPIDSSYAELEFKSQ